MRTGAADAAAAIDRDYPQRREPQEAGTSMSIPVVSTRPVPFFASGLAAM